MKLIHLALAAVTVTSLGRAQGIESILGKRHPAYRSAQQLVTTPSPVGDLFPPDAVWARESFHASSDSFYGRKLVRIHADDHGAWRGLRGTDGYRLYKLTRSRLLLESDSSRSRDFFVIDKQPGGTLIQYSPSRKPDSRFSRALQRAGLATDKNLIRGSRDKILGFLRTYAFDTSDVHHRWQRPTHEDMKEVWKSQLLQAWQDRQQNNLSQTTQRIGQLKQLGQLGIGRVMMQQIAGSGIANLQHGALDKVEFGPSNYALEQMSKRAKQNLAQIETKIQKRMAYLALRIESETLVKGDGGQPEPGDAVRFHCVLKLANGKVVADTRKKGKPSESHIAGKMPEGIAWALCSMRIGGKARFRIPAALAYGFDHGEVVLEVELLGYVRTPTDKAPLRSRLLGYDLAPLDMKETSTRLLYSDMRPGKGPVSTKGKSLVVKRATWTATGQELDKAETITVRPGDANLPAGLHEGLAGMRPGGLRMLCIPRQLGYRSKDRRGMALRMMVSLVRIEP